MNTYNKKTFYKKKEVKIYLLGEYLLHISEASRKSVYYKEVGTGESTLYNISFDMMIGIGYGCGVWKDSGRGFLDITGSVEDWHKFYALVNRKFDAITSKHDSNYFSTKS